MNNADSAALHLVIAPGLVGLGSLYEPFMAALPEWLHPVAVSYPTGEVMQYDRLLPWLRERIPPAGPYVLLGDSFSGPLAVRLAAEHPDRLVALVLVATFVVNPLPQLLKALRSLIGPYIFRTRTPDFAVRRWLLSNRGTDREVEVMRDAIDSVAPEVLADRVHEVMLVDARDALAAVRVPILYLWGKEDRVVLDRSRDVLARIRPDAEVVTIDGPHLLLQHCIPPVAGAIVRFLGRVVPRELS